MRTRLLVAAIASSVVLALFDAAPAYGEPERASPPGQVYVFTANARQQLPVDLKAFRRLYEFVRALRSRPTAFDGGTLDGTAMPDVFIFNEMSESNLEIFRRLLLQRSQFQYEIVAAEGVQEKFLVNTDTMTIQGAPQTIVDPCRSGGTAPPKGYLVTRLTEIATGSPVTVAAVHLKARYDETGQPDCRERNIDAIRTAVTADVGPTIIGGDFNKRPVDVELECDPNEESAPLQWYTMMTAPPPPGRAYLDSVRSFNRERHLSMVDEWTFERLNPSTLCNGAFSYKRSRLDYLFVAGAGVAEAHADHPGWADQDDPGAVPFGKERFTDHRWVWGRFLLTGPPRVSRPSAELGLGGEVDLTWAPVDGATEYVIYRATKWHALSLLSRVPSDQTTFTDVGRDGVPYSYSIAAVGANTGQGRESPHLRVVPDARGPHVIATRPGDGAVGVEASSEISAWFDEHVNPFSIRKDTIRVYREGTRVGGRTTKVSGRKIVFEPARPLRRGAGFYVVIRPVTDGLGNLGERYAFRFHTEAPPKKHKRKHRH